MTKIVVVGLVVLVILATSLALLIEQQYAKAIWIRANLGPSTLTSYSPGGKYYELKDIKIVDSKTCKCPITLTDPLVSSPVVSIRSDSVSLSGTLNAHTSPTDTAFLAFIHSPFFQSKDSPYAISFTTTPFI